jgi:hypothetical protein
VDDADLVQTIIKEDQNFLDVAAQMQRALSAWEGGLKATGGAIVPEKSHWYLIDFIWDSGQWRYQTIEEPHANIEIQDCTGTVKILEHLETSEARRTLGVRLAPDGNNQAEVLFLKERVNNWADRIQTGHLPRRFVWESMHTTIIKSIQYPLLATTMTEAECNAIMAPLLAHRLSGSGIVRTMKRDVVYDPQKYQGLATIANAIKGNGIGVSDGSFKDKFGTACWILQGETADGEIKCPCLVPGNGSVQSAYRSELAGF